VIASRKNIICIWLPSAAVKNESWEGENLKSTGELMWGDWGGI